MNAFYLLLGSEGALADRALAKLLAQLGLDAAGIEASVRGRFPDLVAATANTPSLKLVS